MAKKTKKEYPHKSNLPKADKVVYWILFILACIIPLVLLFGLLMFRTHIAFSDSNVAAARDRVSLLLAMPLFLAIFLGMVIPCYICYEKDKPIFGRKGQAAKPAFAPKKPFCTEQSNPEYLARKAKKLKKEEAEKRTQRWKKILLYAVLGILALMILFAGSLSLYGRDTLQKDGGFKRYNAFNSVSREYSPKDVACVELYCGLESGGSTSEWAVFMKFTYTDGKKHRFSSGDFHGDWLLKMTALKEQFDPSVVNCSDINELSNVIWDRDLDDEETTMLYALFDIQK